MARVKNPTANQIWDTLSKVDVSAHTEDRGGLTYLSWAWAWGVMMEHYPDLQIKWHGQVDGDGIMRDIQVSPGGSSMVNCSVTIGDVKREMWLPVMDYRHKAIANADSRSISDARMRCLTKCFALFGLGHYIYAGEDTPKASANGASPVSPVSPEPPKRTRPKRKPPAKKKEAEKIKPEQNNLSDADIDEAIDELKSVATDLFERGWEPADQKTKKEIGSAIKARDGAEIVRLTKDIKAVGEKALKLHDLKEDEDNG